MECREGSAVEVVEGVGRVGVGYGGGGLRVFLDVEEGEENGCRFRLDGERERNNVWIP